MLMIDQTYCWRGFGNGQGNWDSHCHLRIFRPHPESIVVVVADPGGDSGTSITNCAGELATRIVNEFHLDSELLIWIEQIPTSSIEFSRVEFDWFNRVASHPRWSYLTRLEAEAIAGVPL